MNSKEHQNHHDNSSTELHLSHHSNSHHPEITLRTFALGDTSVLDSSHTIEIVTRYIFELYHNGNMPDTLIILEQLGEAALSENLARRERSLIMLSLLAARILEENNEDLFEAVSRILIHWLKKETEFIVGFEFICLQLSKLIRKMLALALWYQSECCIGVLHDIQKGALQKNKLIKQVVAGVQSKIAEAEVLVKLTDNYLDESSDKCDAAGTLLIRLGDKSIPHLLETLSRCDDKSGRFRLINLIPTAGKDALPYLDEGLKSESPWYVKRNILLMIAGIADPALFDSIRPFLRHNDIRVQKEAVRCVYAMNGKHKSVRLLEAVTLCDHRLLPGLIDMLGPLKEKKTGNILVHLLDNCSGFDSGLRDMIIVKICRYLPDYPGLTSFMALERLMTDTQSHQMLSKKTLTIMAETQAALQMHVDPDPLPEWVELILPRWDEKDEADTPVGMPLILPNHSLSDEKSAKSTMPEWFSHIAADSDIPPPLRKHLLGGKDFYAKLDREEYLEFAPLLTHKSYRKHEYLCSMGDVHSTLFFIEEGEVSLIFPDDGTETTIRRLKKGDIFGHDVFMNGSEWTVALQAAQDTDVFLFDQEQLLKLQAGSPQLCRKILEYCNRHDIVMMLHRASLRLPPEHPETQPIPFTDDMGDHIADIRIVAHFSHGLCFCLTLPDGIDYTLLADREFIATFRSDPAHSFTVKAYMLGLSFKKENRRLCIYMRFLQEKDLSRYDCTKISLRHILGK
jgi:hypothetical protein